MRVFILLKINTSGDKVINKVVLIYGLGTQMLAALMIIII